MVSEITAFEDDSLIVEEQRQGPFRSWKHTQRFELRRTAASASQTRSSTSRQGASWAGWPRRKRSGRELERAFAYRRERLGKYSRRLRLLADPARDYELEVTNCDLKRF